MLTKRSFFKYPLVLVFVLSFCALTSCSDDDTIVASKDLVGKVAERSDLSILVQALEKADLVGALKGSGPFTVFAPNNEAFQKLLDSKAAWSSLDDIPVDVLKSVLLYHVVTTKNASSSLSNGQQIPTLNGASLVVDLSSGVKINTVSGQSASVIDADIDSSNGIVHVINEVLLPVELPKDITDLAIGTADLSILVEALKKANLVSALQAEGSFTVFAPTNQAFQNLLDSNPDWNSLDDIPTDVLTNVLLFHVLGKGVESEGLSDTYVKTLAKGPNDEMLSLQVEVTGGIEFNGDAKPVMVDNMASNGIVHIIDKVMLPPNVVTLALNNSGFTTLVAALTDSRHTVNFVDLLKMDGPYTVFAPTNDAFQALLDSNASWNSLSDIPIATLEAVLKYHVFGGGNVQANELTDNQEITMFDGNMVTVDLSNGAKLETGSGQSVVISLTDVQGTNGVIHVVNNVLLP
ncbi:fasciclin domain-containing protein [uncultured Tenacibaculum sp.]|uniref:fasciclin domain-containing protein n=1 Tax=uncultured Tenacibaculum sp. TaxID=174713 RepID=UPI0026074FCA|nr:fasciclin domain-containing protein [uncultured Tenacibaculum sp.]